MPIRIPIAREAARVRSNSVSGMFTDLLCQAQVDRMTHGAAHGLACLRIQPFPNLPNEPMRRNRVSLSIDRSDSSTIHARGQIGRAHSELQSLMSISYAVFCLKTKNIKIQ